MPGERTRTVSARWSPAEHTTWLVAAQGAGRGRLGSWVRDRVAATLGTGTAAPAAGTGVVNAAPGGLGVSVGEWAGLRAELGRVGNNLNQAVRLANASGVNPARVAEMADAAAGTRFAVAGLLAAVRSVTGVGPATPPVVASRSVSSSWRTRMRSGCSPSGSGWRRSGCTRSGWCGSGRGWLSARRPGGWPRPAAPPSRRAQSRGGRVGDRQDHPGV